MLVRLIANPDIPHVNTPYSKRKKGEIDTETKKYRDSTYWDHALTKFYEKSVAQNHTEAIKEWVLVPDGYEYYPDGRYCDLHKAETKHIYVLRNKLNENELRVGEGCAASHALPLEFKAYSKESFEAMKAQEKEVRLTSMRTLSRKYFETHQGTIEDMLDLAIKYKAFLYADGAEQAIVSLKKIISNYKSAKSAYEGQRENMVYWHRAELQRLNELLASVYTSLPWLKTYPGFERKMRTLWNYRSFFDSEQKLVIEETHARWNHSPTSIQDILINVQDVEKMLKLYEQLISGNNLLEINLTTDGQLRLTLRYLYGYQDLLDEKTRQVYGLVLDALKFLQLRTGKDVEHLQKYITLQAITTATGPKPADFSLNSINSHFNRMINGLWQGTGVIQLEDKGELETYLTEIRGGKITKTEARAKDPALDQKIEVVRTYGMLIGKRKYKVLLENIERWDNDQVYLQAIEAIRSAYTELNNTNIAIEDLAKHNFAYIEKLNMVHFIAQCAAIRPILTELQDIPGQEKEILNKYTYATKKAKIQLRDYLLLQKAYAQFSALAPSLQEKYMPFDKIPAAIQRIFRTVHYQAHSSEQALALREKVAPFLKANIIPKTLLSTPELVAITVTVTDQDLKAWKQKATETITTQDIRLLLETAERSKILLKEEYTRLSNFFEQGQAHSEALLKQYIHNLLMGTNHIEQTIGIITKAADQVALAKIAAQAISKVHYHDTLIDKARLLFTYWRDNGAFDFCIVLAQELLPYTASKTTALLVRILHEIFHFTDEPLLLFTAKNTQDLELLSTLPLNILKKAQYQKADIKNIEQEVVALTHTFLWQANHASLREKIPQLYSLYASVFVIERPNLLKKVISCLPLGLSSVWSKTYSGNWYEKITHLLIDAFAIHPELVLEELLLQTKNIRKISGPLRYKKDYIAGLLDFLLILIENNNLTGDTATTVRNILDIVKNNNTESLYPCSKLLEQKYGK